MVVGIYYIFDQEAIDFWDGAAKSVPIVNHLFFGFENRKSFIIYHFSKHFAPIQSPILGSTFDR